MGGTEQNSVGDEVGDLGLDGSNLTMHLSDRSQKQEYGIATLAMLQLDAAAVSGLARHNWFRYNGEGRK
jgi:hypothetical protein